ncbi:MAG: hypothetical protein R2853_13370 [Thermomicrobiales bacterium]
MGAARATCTGHEVCRRAPLGDCRAVAAVTALALRDGVSPLSPKPAQPDLASGLNLAA